VSEPAACRSTPAADCAPDRRTNIRDLALGEIEECIASLGKEKYRARQIMKWLYQGGATSFSQMTTLAREFRTRMEERFTVLEPEIELVQQSEDGTKKVLFRLSDGLAVAQSSPSRRFQSVTQGMAVVEHRAHVLLPFIAPHHLTLRFDTGSHDLAERRHVARQQELGIPLHAFEEVGPKRHADLDGLREACAQVTRGKRLEGGGICDHQIGLVK